VDAGLMLLATWALDRQAISRRMLGAMALAVAAALVAAIGSAGPQARGFLLPLLSAVLMFAAATVALRRGELGDLWKRLRALGSAAAPP